MNSIRTKLALQFFVTNAATAIGFLLSIYIARLLTPAEIGIFSITSVLVGFVHVFRDFGVVSYIRSQKELTPGTLRASMGVMITASWTFATVLFLVSPYAAVYYNQPGIRDAMRVLAVGFLFIPFGAIPQAVLGRDLQVERQAIVTTVSVTVYATTCIILANLGFSYMSFAWANLVNIIACSISYTLVRPKDLPWLPSYKGWRKVVSFGGGTMLTNSIKSIDTALPDLMLGRLSGPHFVGLFSRANSTVNILNYISGPTIHYAALPYLAKVHHSGSDLSLEIKRVVAYLTGIMWPALITIALFASEIIELLYGRRWLECAPIIPFLCITCAVQTTFSVLHPALTSIGRPYLIASPVLLCLVVKIALTIMFFNGTLLSFAKMYMVSELVTIPAYLLLARRFLRLPISAWAKSIWHSATASLFLLLVLQTLHPLIFGGFDSVLMRLCCAVAVAIPTWMAAIFLLKHPLASELQRLKAWLFEIGLMKRLSKKW